MLLPNNPNLVMSSLRPLRLKGLTEHDYDKESDPVTFLLCFHLHPVNLSVLIKSVEMYSLVTLQTAKSATQKHFC